MLEIKEFILPDGPRNTILGSNKASYFTGDLVTLLEENTDTIFHSGEKRFTNMIQIKDWLLSIENDHSEDNDYCDGSSGGRCISVYFNQDDYTKIYLHVDWDLKRPESELPTFSPETLIDLIDQWIELYPKNTKLFLTYDGTEYKLHGQDAQAELLQIAEEQKKKDPSFYSYSYSSES